LECSIWNTLAGIFTEEHQRTITTLAAQVAIALENARLYEEIARQERRLERDWLARSYSVRLLPQTQPEAGSPGRGGEVCTGAGHRRGSLRFHPYSLHGWGIVVGDVSGKARRRLSMRRL